MPDALRPADQQVQRGVDQIGDEGRRDDEGRRPGDPDTLIADNRRMLATLPRRLAHDDLDVIIRDAITWERALAGAARTRAGLRHRIAGV